MCADFEEDTIAIGPYRLGQPFPAIQHLFEEVDSSAYAVLGTVFDDERIYTGPPFSWLDYTWETTVGVTGDRIYKIVYDLLSETEDLSELHENAYEYLQDVLGDHDDSKEHGAMLIWDMDWGNVILSQRVLGGIDGVNIILTWGAPLRSMPPQKAFGKVSAQALHMAVVPPLSRKFREEFLTAWSPEDQAAWCFLRANEWSEWPLFVTQPIAPVMLLFLPWWYVPVGVVVLSWLWRAVRARFVSVSLMRFGVYFVLLKWPVSIGVGIYLVTLGKYWLAALAGFWPIATVILMIFTPPPGIGEMQQVVFQRLLRPHAKEG